MEIIIPDFGKKQNPAGTYKIIFNDRWFYIGSSKKLRSRFRHWKVMFSGKTKLKNINIIQILPQVTKIEFSVLRIYADSRLIINAETKLIKKHWSNPLLLNRCPEGHTNKGMRPYNGQVREKDKPRLPIGFNRKKVAIFDMSGKLIEICESIKAASKQTGVKDDVIRKIFNGRQIRPRRFIFKPVSTTGEILEPPSTTKITLEIARYICDNYLAIGCAELSRRFNISQALTREIARGIRYKKFIRNVVPKGVEPAKKPVSKFDINGNLIETYQSIREAARSVPVKASAVQGVLSGRNGRKICKGFIFKYA